MSVGASVGIGVSLTSSALCVLFCGIHFGNWLTANAVTGPTQEMAAQVFEKAAILGKGGLIVALITLAVMNGNVSYVSQNPNKFMQDALATAGFGALAAVFLTLTRGRRDLFFNHLIFAFMLFFLYHVCREFAGYFTVFGNEQKTQQIQTEESKSKVPLAVTGVFFVIVAIILAVVAHVKPDYTVGILGGFGETTALVIETIIFVAIVSAGEIIVAKNHGDPVGPAIGTSALMFTVVHLVLQAGGFYDHLYKTTHVVANSIANAVNTTKTN